MATLSQHVVDSILLGCNYHKINSSKVILINNISFSGRARALHAAISDSIPDREEILIGRFLPGTRRGYLRLGVVEWARTLKERDLKMNIIKK